jgi:hypothetical protein
LFVMDSQRATAHKHKEQLDSHIDRLRPYLWSRQVVVKEVKPSS